QSGQRQAGGSGVDVAVDECRGDEPSIQVGDGRLGKLGSPDVVDEVDKRAGADFEDVPPVRADQPRLPE
ncbi:hypothetical protein C6A85_10190, partial [Mycobacterium sp. ITM-2017-0098]